MLFKKGVSGSVVLVANLAGMWLEYRLVHFFVRLFSCAIVTVDGCDLNESPCPHFRLPQV